MGTLLLGGAGVARNLPRLARLAEGCRIRLAAATVPWSRLGDAGGGRLGGKRLAQHRELVAAEARSAALVGSSPDALFGSDRDGLITVWSPGAERLFGYTAVEAIGQSISPVHSPVYPDVGQAIARRVWAGERIENYETEQVCKDGSVVTVSLSVSPVYDPGGRVIGTSSIARDLTSVVRAREELALQAELLNEVDAAVVFLDVPGVDIKGVVRYWSGGAQRLYGYTAEEAIGHELVDLVMPEEGRAEMIRLRATALAGQPVDGEFDVHDKQGQVFPIYVRVRPVSPAAGYSMAVSTWSARASALPSATASPVPSSCCATRTRGHIRTPKK